MAFNLNPPPRPRKGDQLFRGDLPDYRNNACLDVYGHHEPHAYTEGYLRGAELLVQHVAQNGSDQDYLVYPIVFLYRHHLELALKRIIGRSPRLLDRELTDDEKKHLANHRLDLLWQDLKPMFSDICKAVGWEQPEPDDVEGADEYVRQITALDRDSFSFRYWESKKGERSLPDNLTRINLRHFAEMMNRLTKYIDGIDTAASVVEGWQDDMESSYGY